jgi:hypothetical protein
MLTQERRPEVAAEFRHLRQEADRWQAHRTEYMMQRMQAGRHPDTDPAFWQKYQELPYTMLYTGEEAPRRTYLVIIGATVVISLLSLRMMRRRRSTRTPTPA